MSPKPILNTLALTALVASLPATASFHFMQIEQVLGGYCGDTSAQAIQLRMRLGGQNLVSGIRLIAHDATGANPITLISFPGNVANGASGSRILAATADFPTAGGPAPDFTLTNPIPPAYLEAGKITFQTAGGTVYWSIAWGGAAYTGSNNGDATNDPDGNFNPPFAESLPYSGNTAVLFTGGATAQSTNNAADYAISASPATFTNNAGAAGALGDCFESDGYESIDE